MKNVPAVALVMGCVSLLAPSARAQKAVRKPLSSSYVRKDLGFSVVPPSGWYPTRKYLPTDMLVVFCKARPTSYQPIITLTAKDFPTPTLPPNFAERLNKNYKDQYAEYVLIGTSQFKLAGKDAVSIAFTTRSPKTQVLVDLRRVYVVHRDKLLIFEIIAEVADFDVQVPAFDKMMRTLVFQP